MVGLGFRPMTAAVICLIANTAPVAGGALGTPIITLAAVTGLPDHLLSMQAGYIMSALGKKVYSGYAYRTVIIVGLKK